MTYFFCFSGVPFVVIAVCYVRIWIHLMYRQSMVVTTARSSADERRRRRLLKMLVAMVVIYLLAWLPVNSLNVLRDATSIDHQEYFVILFLFAHLSSMSATCWNPIVYAWMNDNFRREFKAVLPCFKNLERFHGRTYSITAGRRSMATGLANSPSCLTNRPSAAGSVDSPNTAHPRMPKVDSRSLDDVSICDIPTPKRRDQIQAVSVGSGSCNGSPCSRRAQSEITFNTSSPRRSPTGTIIALLTTPTRSKATTARIAARKPTGKRIKGHGAKSGNHSKGLSPRRIALANSMNGGLNVAHNGRCTESEDLLPEKHNGNVTGKQTEKPKNEKMELISVQTTL